MTKMSAQELGSYAGSAVSVGASLTLTDIGVIVGIVTALLTFVVNVVYVYRKDRREQRESQAALSRIGEKHD